jgi:hypothetical protein
LAISYFKGLDLEQQRRFCHGPDRHLSTKLIIVPSFIASVSSAPAQKINFEKDQRGPMFSALGGHPNAVIAVITSGFATTLRYGQNP